LREGLEREHAGGQGSTFALAAACDRLAVATESNPFASVNEDLKKLVSALQRCALSRYRETRLQKADVDAARDAARRLLVLLARGRDRAPPAEAKRIQMEIDAIEKSGAASDPMYAPPTARSRE
jgi:hypothetical protein